MTQVTHFLLDMSDSHWEKKTCWAIMFNQSPGNEPAIKITQPELKGWVGMLDYDDFLTSFTSFATARSWYTAITAPSTKFCYSALMIFRRKKTPQILKQSRTASVLK